MEYKNNTTWQPAWKHGKTQVIRVPIALATKVLEYARALDSQQEIDVVLGAIEKYIEWKRQSYHPNQHSRELDINTRAWDELRKFKEMLEKGHGDKL